MHCGVVERDYPDYGVLRKMYDNCKRIMCEIDNGIVVRSNTGEYVGVRVESITDYSFKNESILIF